LTAHRLDWYTEGFHAHDGWYFKRCAGGDVQLTHIEMGHTVETARFSLHEWGSIVASMSVLGEDGGRWEQALKFHGGTSKLDNDAAEAALRASVKTNGGI
jgi:hypothetical protein